MVGTATGVVTAVEQIAGNCLNDTNALCQQLNQLVPATDALEKSPCLNGVTTEGTVSLACSQEAAPPPAPVLDDGDPGTSFPANQLTGTVVTGAAVAAVNVPVHFYVEPASSLADSVGDVLQVDYLGTARTDATGNFVFQLPALDSYAQSVATANNGQLNILATSAVMAHLPNSTNAADRAEYADADIPLKINGSAMYFMSQPPTLTLMPVQDVASRVDANSVPQVYDPTDATVDPAINYTQPSENTFTENGVPVSAAEYNPFLVNGIDYRDAVPTGAGFGPAAVPPPPPYQETYEDCSTQTEFVPGYPRVIDTHDSWVIVGEAHAYWNAFTQFTYGTTADSEIQVGFSADGEHWGAHGDISIHNSTTGAALHFHEAQGPYWAHQVRVLFHFAKVEYRYHCYDKDGNEIVWSFFRVTPTKCQWVMDKDGGKDVSKYDGLTPYSESKQSYRNWVGNGTVIDINKGHAYHYSYGFNAFGVSLGVVSGYSQYTTVTLDAGNGQQGLRHNDWGNSGKPPDTQITYSD